MRLTVYTHPSLIIVLASVHEEKVFNCFFQSYALHGPL